MEGGTECIRVIPQEDEDTNSVNAILAIMSIANEYDENFQAMRQNADISPTDIAAGLMKNMRKIFFVLENSANKSPVIQLDDVLNKLRTYTSGYKRNRSKAAAGSGEYENSIKSAAKCYRTLIGINHGPNEAFFRKLTTGFEIASALIRDVDKNIRDDERWTSLETICKELSESRLNSDLSDFDKHEEDELNAWLRR